MLAIIYIIALLAVPLVMHLRGAEPAALFAGLAVVHIAFAALVSVWFFVAPGSFVWAFVPDQALRSGADAIREQHTMSDRPARSLRTLAALWGAMALAVWLISRWQALFFPGAVKAAFWALNLSLLLSFAATVGMTFLVLGRGAAPAPDVFDLKTNLKFVNGVGLVLALAGLLALLTDAVFRRLRHSPARN